MGKRSVVSLAAALLFGLGSSIATSVVQADFEPWDMMDPEWWFGDDDDDDWRYRHYGPGRYAYGGPYSWGGPYGWGGSPGYYGYPHALTQQSNTAQQAPVPQPLPE